MLVVAEKAISFKCEMCGYEQFFDYTLVPDWEAGRAVMADNIECSECGHENRVIEE